MTRPSPRRRYRQGVLDAITDWSRSLERAHAAGDAASAQEALDRLATAVRLGRGAFAGETPVTHAERGPAS